MDLRPHIDNYTNITLYLNFLTLKRYTCIMKMHGEINHN